MKKDSKCKHTKSFFGYCYNCFAYGHKCKECTKPRFNDDNRMYGSANSGTSKPLEIPYVIRNGVMCYKFNNFRHIARDCR